MTAVLPPYSADFPICPKCKGESASTQYKETLGCMYADHAHETVVGVGHTGNPRLCRRCTRCGFAWDEACEDAPSSKVDLSQDSPELAEREAIARPNGLGSSASNPPPAGPGSTAKAPAVHMVTINHTPPAINMIPLLVEEQRHARMKRQRSLPGNLTSTR